MTGAWIFVCGPSGAGKDSVISAAQQRLTHHKNIIFARRIVTRSSQAGSEHDPMNEQDFRSLIDSGGLSWHWQAHDFFYGIAAHYAADVQGGRLVVINGSRAHVSGLERTDAVKVVEVSASKDQVTSRLQQRGRDDPQAIAERLARNASLGEVKADCLIVNDSALSTAGQKLASYLLTNFPPFTLQP